MKFYKIHGRIKFKQMKIASSKKLNMKNKFISLILQKLWNMKNKSIVKLKRKKKLG
jgi:hypothetical protein